MSESRQVQGGREEEKKAAEKCKAVKMINRGVFWKERDSAGADPVLNLTTSSKRETDGGRKPDLHRRQYQSPKMRSSDGKGYKILRRLVFHDA